MSDKVNEEFFKSIKITNKKRKCEKPAATAPPPRSLQPRHPHQEDCSHGTPTKKTATTAAPTPGEKLNSAQKGNFSKKKPDKTNLRAEHRVTGMINNCALNK